MAAAPPPLQLPPNQQLLSITKCTGCATCGHEVRCAEKQAPLLVARGLVFTTFPAEALAVDALCPPVCAQGGRKGKIQRHTKQNPCPCCPPGSQVGIKPVPAAARDSAVESDAPWGDCVPAGVLPALQPPSGALSLALQDGGCRSAPSGRCRCDFHRLQLERKVCVGWSRLRGVVWSLAGECLPQYCC